MAKKEHYFSELYARHKPNTRCKKTFLNEEQIS